MIIGVVDAEPKSPTPGIGTDQATPNVLTFPEFMLESSVARVLA
jgi:hypothetical protein